MHIYYLLQMTFLQLLVGRLRGLAVVCWTTDHYHTCSNPGVGISEVARPIQPTLCTKVAVKHKSSSSSSSLVISDIDISTLYQRANVEKNDLFECFFANGLSLNKNKTKYMVFKGGTKNYDFSILDISWNFFGVFLDETLSWKYHFTYVKNKISRGLYGIKQVKNFLPKIV